MDEKDLKGRTQGFALRVIRLTEALPKNRVADVIGRQLLRSGTSVGANYRAACRARSRAEFIAKLGIVEEELDESGYWMELLRAEGIVKADRLHGIQDETNQLLSIIVKSIKSAKANR